MRLDKFLSECGVGSRTQVKQLLKHQTVLVNGIREKSPKTQVNENEDVIVVNGKQLLYKKYLYYLLNKPKGVVSATEDKEHQTVLDLLDEQAQKKGVFPVGRLDIDTHGLLLLTNNGALAHAMLSPKKHVAKTYQASIQGLMNQEDVLAFEKGIELSDFTCQSAKLDILDKDAEKEISNVQITIVEGKFHQIKRMVSACNKKVIDLKRITMEPIQLDPNLALGEWRYLTKTELSELEIFGVDL